MKTKGHSLAAIPGTNCFPGVQSTYTRGCLNPRVQDTSALPNRTKFLSTVTLEIRYKTKCAPQD
jgi:hypothetical protein